MKMCKAIDEVEYVARAAMAAAGSLTCRSNRNTNPTYHNNIYCNISLLMPWQQGCIIDNIHTCASESVCAHSCLQQISHGHALVLVLPVYDNFILPHMYM